MATTGELRAIIEDLELVDIGDAATYLGEEANVGGGDVALSEQIILPLLNDLKCGCGREEACSLML
ncbi:hypothetical protein [Ktedonospora formicarum]|uniref:Uncharacterized protein n=1 Tax=Ktedonospora formicarum TaxID=2778364 RepID=A0A8J3HUA1_9CHLR|nr:hypothetical protein [Ktedonospora formicarum]GHO43401.1 hypothetical protein KSX_15640 [Ktedonospora formicarum]